MPLRRPPGTLHGLVLTLVAGACLIDNPGFQASDGATDSHGESGAGAASSGSSSASSSASSPTTSTTAATTAVDDTTSAPPPGCDGLECGMNATCVGVGDRVHCECDPGYSGDGLACLDIDECVDGPCAPGVCINDPGDFHCAYPATCAELLALVPGAPDGDHSLFVENDPAKPWGAYCHDMAGTPREYLTLPVQGGDANVSRYVGDQPGESEATRYLKIRLTPGAWLVDIGDSTFTTSEGDAYHGPNPVLSVSYGVAMTCNGTVTTAGIDLHQTPFHVFNAFCMGGENPQGGSQQGDPQVITLTGGGLCGWLAPNDGGACPYNPIDNVGGSVLRLMYSP